MNLYQQTFTKLKQQQQIAFIPFVTLADPNPELSLQIVKTLIAAGADALELGIPFSDPLADGPTIQAATLRALQSGATTTSCLQMIQQIKHLYPAIPIGILTYANIVYRHKISNFYQQCAQAGVDSVLIADVPLEEHQAFQQAAQQAKVASVYICPPNASANRIQQIAANSHGYVYLLSRAGVTGSENAAFAPLESLVKQLKAANSAPIVQGFGISTPEQVVQAIRTGVDGVISGSAVVKIIEQNQADPSTLLNSLKHFVSQMKQAANLTIQAPNSNISPAPTRK